MKKLVPILLLLLWTFSHAVAQKGISINNGSVDFQLPEDDQYNAGDVIIVPFLASNNTGNNEILMHCTFELKQGENLFFSQEIDPIILTVIPQTFTGEIEFVFPSECELPNGDYQLSLEVFYTHNSLNSINMDTEDINSNSSCSDTQLPAGNPGTSEVCSLYFPNIDYSNGTCCNIPSIQINSTKFLYVWRCECSFLLEPTIDFPFGAPNYASVWTNSANQVVSTCRSIDHYCGEETYTLTIRWFENGTICTASQTITTSEECCECLDKSECSGEVGGGNGGISALIPLSLDDKIKDTGNNLISGETILFPNPNQGQFKLRFPEDKEIRTIEVWNLNGDLLRAETGPFEMVHPVELTKEAPGTYYLRIEFVDGTNELQRFIVN